MRLTSGLTYGVRRWAARYGQCWPPAPWCRRRRMPKRRRPGTGESSAVPVPLGRPATPAGVASPAGACNGGPVAAEATGSDTGRGADTDGHDVSLRRVGPRAWPNSSPARSLLRRRTRPVPRRLCADDRAQGTIARLERRRRNTSSTAPGSTPSCSDTPIRGSSRSSQPRWRAAPTSYAPACSSCKLVSTAPQRNGASPGRGPTHTTLRATRRI